MGKKTDTSSRLRAAIEEIMKDEKKRKISDIQDELSKRGFILGEDYNTNHISGVLRTFREAGCLENPDRGVYQKKNADVKEKYEEKSTDTPKRQEESEAHIKEVSKIEEEFICSIRQGIQYLNAETEHINYSELAAKDGKRLIHLIEVKEEIEKILKSVYE